MGMHVYTITRMHVCMRACMYACVYVCMDVCMYVWMYVWMYVCICVLDSGASCIRVITYTCIPIHTVYWTLVFTHGVAIDGCVVSTYGITNYESIQARDTFKNTTECSSNCTSSSRSNANVNRDGSPTVISTELSV